MIHEISLGPIEKDQGNTWQWKKSHYLSKQISITQS